MRNRKQPRLRSSERPDLVTTEQLAEMLLETVKRMSADERAKLRAKLRREFGIEKGYNPKAAQ